MKRKSVNSEPANAGRPRKSPRASEISIAVGGVQLGPKAKSEPMFCTRVEPASASTSVQSSSPEEAVSERPLNQTETSQETILAANREFSRDNVQEVEAHSEKKEDGTSEWEEQQAIRARRYIWFSGEDLDDYTYGPVRVINCHDGVSTCACVLLSLDFTAKVRDALRQQREFEKLQREVARKFGRGIRFEDDIDAEISSHQCRLRRSVEDQDNVTETSEHRSLQVELNILEQMLAKSKSDRQHDKVVLNGKAETLRRVQAKANAYLEEAFVVADLLEPASDQPDTPIQDLDLQEEYQRFRQNQEAGRSEAPITPLDVSRDHMYRPPPSPEEQARRDVTEAWWSAHDRLQRAHEDFESKEASRARARQAFKEAAKREERVEVDIAEEFDLPWLKRFQEITRELGDAEEAFAVAKANALEAGMDIRSQDNFSFATSVEEVPLDQPIQIEENLPYMTPNPMVARWLDSLSRSTSPSRDGGALEDDRVGFGEGYSGIAEGTVRNLINKWQQMCNREIGNDQASEDNGSRDKTSALERPEEKTHVSAPSENGVPAEIVPERQVSEEGSYANQLVEAEVPRYNLRKHKSAPPEGTKPAEEVSDSQVSEENPSEDRTPEVKVPRYNLRRRKTK